mgnify:CR=1 FL=1
MLVELLIEKYRKALESQIELQKTTPLEYAPQHQLLDQNVAIFREFIEDLESLRGGELNAKVIALHRANILELALKLKLKDREDLKRIYNFVEGGGRLRDIVYNLHPNRLGNLRLQIENTLRKYEV